MGVCPIVGEGVVPARPYVQGVTECAHAAHQISGKIPSSSIHTSPALYQNSAPLNRRYSNATTATTIGIRSVSQTSVTEAERSISPSLHRAISSPRATHPPASTPTSSRPAMPPCGAARTGGERLTAARES